MSKHLGINAKNTTEINILLMSEINASLKVKIVISY